MKTGNTFFIAAFIGAAWMAIHTIVFSVLAMLISGQTVVPDIGSALIAGVVGAAVYILMSPDKRNWQWVLVSSLVAFFCFANN